MSGKPLDRDGGACGRPSTSTTLVILIMLVDMTVRVDAATVRVRSAPSRPVGSSTLTRMDFARRLCVTSLSVHASHDNEKPGQ